MEVPHAEDRRFFKAVLPAAHLRPLTPPRLTVGAL